MILMDESLIENKEKSMNPSFLFRIYPIKIEKKLHSNSWQIDNNPEILRNFLENG